MAVKIAEIFWNPDTLMGKGLQGPAPLENQRWSNFLPLDAKHYLNTRLIYNDVKTISCYYKIWLFCWYNFIFNSILFGNFLKFWLTDFLAKKNNLDKNNFWLNFFGKKYFGRKKFLVKKN